MWRVVVIVVLLCSTAVVADLPRSIVIDGSFGDWATVPVMADPVRALPTDAAPLQGFPLGPDVHVPLPSDRLCDAGRVSVFDSSVDVASAAIAHDDDTMFGCVSTLAPLRSARLVLLIDADNALSTGTAAGQGGYYPDTAGIDVALALDIDAAGRAALATVIVFTNNTSAAAAQQAIVATGALQFDSRCPWQPHVQYVFFGAVKPASVAGCEPVQIAGGAWICFISAPPNASLPVLGRAQVAVAAGQLEFSVPFDALLRVLAGARPVLSLGSTVRVALALSSANASDATYAWAYAFERGPPANSLAVLIVVPIVTLVVGFCLGAIANHCYAAISAKRKDYTTL